MKKATGGRPGRYFVEVDGETYACLPGRWFRKGAFRDPHFRPDEVAFQKAVDAVKASGKVVLTNDEWDEGTHRARKRLGYIGLFSVADVEVHGTDLSFSVTDRLEDLK